MGFLCIDFINSQWYKTHKMFREPLEDENWLQAFCNRWNLPAADIFDRETIDSLLALRSFLSHVTNDIYARKTISSEDIDMINEYLASFSFYKTVKKEGNKYYSDSVPNQSGLCWTIYVIISSFVEIITDYKPEQIKICENPDCKWVFYDQSKSHTRKWCDNTCATLMKVRRYRENHKAASRKQQEKVGTHT